MSTKYKVIMVGDSTVGKTSLVNFYVDKVVCDDFVSTVGVDFKNKSLIINDQEIVLQIWDTAGQEKFRSITKSYFRRADAIVVVFDINNRDTFNAVQAWMTSIEEQLDRKVPIALIGNKLDIGQQIPYQEIDQVAEKYKVQYFSTSAKTGEGIEECFLYIANSIFENAQNPHEEEEDIQIDKYSGKKGKKDCC